jgi:hypothetical protein
MYPVLRADVPKIAALKRATPQKWYEYSIKREFKTVVDNHFIVDGLDAEMMKKLFAYDE